MIHPHKILSSLSIQVKKRLGQNFIVSDSAIQFLKKYLPQEANIFEIGAGLGIITNFLLIENKNVISIEKDRDLQVYWDTYTHKNLHIIFDDFLSYPPEQIKKFTPTVIIGNLPFYISTPIIERIIYQYLFIHTFMIGVQREYAEKCLSTKGNSLGIFLNTIGKTQKLANIKKTSYYPIPNVDTTWFKWKRIETDLNKVQYFEDFLKGCFWGKRKSLWNTLINNPFFKQNQYKEIRPILLNAKGKHSFPDKIEKLLLLRPDALHVDDYKTLHEFITNLKENK